MSIQAIASRPAIVDELRPLAGSSTQRVPPHITAAAQSLGISAAQLSAAITAGSSLTELAQARGISHQDLVAAMVANPPAGLAAMIDAEVKRPGEHIDVFA